MKKILYGAVFFLALTLALSLSLVQPVSLYAAGDEVPTPTPTPLVEEEVADEVENKGGMPLYGGVPVYNGVPVYGGGIISPREGDVLIEKKVLNPASGIYVDHLSPTDPMYHPLDIISFQIRVQNSGEEELSEIVLTDTLPDYLDYMSGPGEYDEENRQVNFTVDNIVGGASEVFEIKARISHQSTLSEDKNVVCPVNVVEAVAGERTDRDESQFCIEKEQVPPPAIPESGPAGWMITIPGLFTSLFAGFYLKRKLS